MHELRESQMRSDRAAILTRHRDPDRSRDVRAARRRARVCADPHAGFRPAGGGVRGDCRMRASVDSTNCDPRRMAAGGGVCDGHPPPLAAWYVWNRQSGDLCGGGALGGVFVALIAPRIFRSFYEMPLGLVVCAVLVMLALSLDAEA